MTEFCPLPLDTVTKRRFWESLPERDKVWFCDNPEWLPMMFDYVTAMRVIADRRHSDNWERQWKRREWRRV